MTREIIRYSLQSASEAGYPGHPQTAMRELADLEGFEIVDAEAVPIGDCWIFLIAYEKRPRLAPFIDRDLRNDA